MSAMHRTHQLQPQIQQTPLLRRRSTVVAISLLLCLALTLISAALTSPWKLDLALDNDTVRYYDTQTFTLHGVGSFFSALADPFFRAKDAGVIEAPAGKPVFVSLLRLWGMGVRALFGLDAWVTRSSYYHFQLLTYGLLALSICSLGWRLESPYLGMLAASVAVLNPWALVQLVYRNYTCLGMALFLFACILAARRTMVATLLAGLLAWMAFLTDNAILVYAGVLGLVVVALNLSGGWRRTILHAALYGAGLAAPYLLLSLVGAIWYPKHDWPLHVTVDYFSYFAKANHFATRPPPEARPNVPKYPGIALLFIAHNSRVICALLVSAILVLYWKVAKLGPRAAVADKSLATMLALFAPVLLCWIAIDVKPGAQLAHTYFVGYPVVALGLALLWWRFGNRGMVLRSVWAVLALLYIVETIAGLHRYRVVFFSLQNTIAATLPADKHQKIALFYNDPHAKIIQHLLSPEYADRIVIVLTMAHVARIEAGKGPETICLKLAGKGLLDYQETRLGADDSIACILYGPEGETITYTPPTPLWNDDPAHGERKIPTAGGIIYDVPAREVARFSDPANIPFYGLYPLLIFDDEWPTWKYITGLITDDSCMRGPGAIRMVTLTRSAAASR
jgi:hypothetical protein